MFTGMDITLHGGWSFLLVLAACFFLRKHEPRVALSMVFSVVILIGIAVEVVEFYIGIDFWAGDIVIDALGALAGVAVWALLVPYLSLGHTSTSDHE